MGLILVWKKITKNLCGSAKTTKQVSVTKYLVAILNEYYGDSPVGFIRIKILICFYDDPSFHLWPLFYAAESKN